MTENDLVEWHELLSRYGFMTERDKEASIRITDITMNIGFFRDILMTLDISECFNMETRLFLPPDDRFSESAFLDSYYENHHNAEGGYCDDLSVLEPHIARLVRAVNRVGIETFGSCEGHFRTYRRTNQRNRIVSESNDEEEIRVFKPGYIDGGKRTTISLILLNNNLAFKENGSYFAAPRIRNANREERINFTPERQAKALWDEFQKTAIIIENNEVKVRKMVKELDRAIHLRDEFLNMRRRGASRA